MVYWWSVAQYQWQLVIVNKSGLVFGGNYYYLFILNMEMGGKSLRAAKDST